MKNFLFPFCLLAFYICYLPSYILHAQGVHPVSGEPLKYCGSTEATEDLYKKYPHLKEAAEIIERQQMRQKTNPEPTINPPMFTIPVVIHILHNYGPENIPDANVHDALRVMNEDFNKLNADTTQVVAAFKALVGDAQIEFKLARLDPNGNCTNGIDRIATSKTYEANNASKLNIWPRRKYLNVWTVHDLASGAAGYTYRPASVAGNPGIDGIVILYDYFGALAPSSRRTSRTLTHEIGHWINLAHPWGNNNQAGVSCGDDGVSDTPRTKGWTSCNLSTNDVCASGVQENVQNYMEYAYCYRMFTIRQAIRMKSALFSSTAQRNNLSSSSNLTATGVNTPALLCTADFSSTKKVVCVGYPVSFSDLSWNTTPTSWQWDFDNDGTTDATTQNPSYTYSAPGVYSVKLTVGDGITTKTVTKSSLIVVLANTASTQAPFSESFENTGYPYSDWYNLSASSSAAMLWNRVTTAAYTGSASLKLDNYSVSSGDIISFITPSVDLSIITSPTMTFRLAYRRKSSSDILDELKIFNSVNCGNSWVLRYIKKSAALATVANSSGAFTPTTTSQWRQDNISISNVNGKDNVRFKFQFTGNGVGAGNNIYIDDINITGNLSVAEEFTNGFDLNIFPNPFNDNTTISFTLLDKYNVAIGVYDIIGKEIISLSNTTKLSAGSYSFPLNKATLKQGIYLIKLEVNGYSVMRKVVVQ